MGNRLDTDKIESVRVNSCTVILRGKSGTSIEGADVKKVIGLIEKSLRGNYVIIFDRINDYSVAPVGVYKYLNSRSHLQAIAMVTYRSISNTVSAVELSLCKKPMEVFDHLQTALQWASKQMPQSNSPPLHISAQY